uniref:KAT8 regulatory NSL complex subunit 2 n=1 Tax=Anopheles atroparvus TaxID=41427 RepID=A0AAG5D552_ANOAO
MGHVQQQVRTMNRNAPGGSAGGPSNEQEETFRCQIHQEIERKAKVCANTLFECSLPRVESYAYCFRHILQDPKAPYKQCGFTYPNGRRCPEPSPRYDAKKDYGTNYCFEHSRQTQLAKTKSTIGKLVPVETTETLLHSLAHHVKVDKNKQHYMGNNTPLKITVHEDDDDNEVDVVTPSVDPFVDVDVTAIVDSGRIVLDYASDSSSEDEDTQQPTYGSSWKGQDMDNSDNESVDSQCDDPLKHAGIYTAEETTRITKEKLSRLQSLYVEQIHRLQHVLRERRRNYLRDQRVEREAHCSIYDQINETPRERTLYEKLKGMNRYHRKHGVEAILQRKYLEKRAKATEGLQQKPPPLPKCSYTEGGVKCGERTLPCCKHCRKHILEDKKQVLFRACGIEKSGVVCQEPLAGLFENVTCPLHVELPAQRSFNKRKYESESEGEADPGDGDGTFVAGDNAIAGGASSDSAITQNDRKKAKDVLNPAESKPVVKTESKRRSIKQEVPTPPRVRNTRAARAALGRQHTKKHLQPAGTGVLQGEVTGIKQELEEPDTNAQQQQQPTPAAKDEDEEQLPITIIPKKKPKPEEGHQENSDSALTAATNDGQQEKMDTSTSEEQADGGSDASLKHEPQAEDGGQMDLPKPSNNEERQNDDESKQKIEEKTVQDTVIPELVPENPINDSKTGKSNTVAGEPQNLQLEEQISTKEKLEREESKSHSSPEPSKRRREQKRDKNKAAPSKSADKEEPTRVEGPGGGPLVASSDEEKGNKAKQPKSKPDPVEAGTQPKSAEKSRRQQK